jgi:hypothetical protein
LEKGLAFENLGPSEQIEGQNDEMFKKRIFERPHFSEPMIGAKNSKKMMDPASKTQKEKNILEAYLPKKILSALVPQ